MLTYRIQRFIKIIQRDRVKQCKAAVPSAVSLVSLPSVMLEARDRRHADT